MRTRIPSTFFYGLLILFSSLFRIECDVMDEDEYLNYIQAVTHHLQNQPGWNTMEHIQMLDTNFKNQLNIKRYVSVPKFLQDQSLSHIKLFNKIAELVNCRYADLLKTICKQLLEVTNECNYHVDSDINNALFCIVSVHEILNYSRELFENLYKALTYLSLIDVKIVNKTFKNFTDYIVDELSFIKTYVSSLKKADYSNYTDDFNNFDMRIALHDLKYIEGLCESILPRLDNILSRNNRIIVHTNEVDYKQMYKFDQLENRVYFVSQMSFHIKEFMDRAVENDFTQLGFPQLLNPTEYDWPVKPYEFTPNITYRSEVLNTMFQEIGWPKMYYISIRYSGHAVTSNRVVRDEVNEYNYHVKKEQMLYLLGCRYVEILKNVDAIVGAMFLKCQRLHNISINAHYNCLIEFSSQIHKMKGVLDIFTKATAKLDELSFWETQSRFHTTLHPIIDIVKAFYKFLKENPVIKFTITSENMSRYQKTLDEERQKLYTVLQLQRVGNKCIYNVPLLQSESVEEFFEIDSKAPHEELFAKLEEFCNQAMVENYEELGFTKFHGQ